MVCSLAIVAVGVYQTYSGWRSILLAVRLDRATLLIVAETGMLVGIARLGIGIIAFWHYPMYEMDDLWVIPLLLAINLLELRKIRRLRQLFPLTGHGGGTQSRNLQL